MQAVVLVEQQVTRCLAVAYGQGCIGMAVEMLAVKGSEINVGQDVGVVYQKRFAIVQQALCFQYASSRVEQFASFVADVQVKAKVVVGLQEINDLLSEVMDVDHYFPESGCLDTQQRVLQHGYACHGDKCLGHVVGQWTQPGTQSGCEYHGFHGGQLRALKVCSMFCSRCTRLTCTPNSWLRCSARCWAEYTERCCPPVQPKQTDRLVKPRSM